MHRRGLSYGRSKGATVCGISPNLVKIACLRVQTLVSQAWSGVLQKFKNLETAALNLSLDTTPS